MTVGSPTVDRRMLDECMEYFRDYFLMDGPAGKVCELSDKGLEPAISNGLIPL